MLLQLKQQFRPLGTGVRWKTCLQYDYHFLYNFFIFVSVYPCKLFTFFLFGFSHHSIVYHSHSKKNFCVKKDYTERERKLYAPVVRRSPNKRASWTTRFSSLPLANYWQAQRERANLVVRVAILSDSFGRRSRISAVCR